MRRCLPLIAGLLATPALAQPASLDPTGDAPTAIEPVPAQQTAPAPARGTAAAPTARAPATGEKTAEGVQPGDVIDFQSDWMTYDDKADIVTATGNVIVQRGGQRMRADKIIYNRKTGNIQATGDLIVVDQNGNRLFGDRGTMDDDIRNATIDNILVVLENGGRLAGVRGTRVNNVDTIYRAVYSPCAVSDGCSPRRPVWQVRAVRVVHDPNKHRLYYRGAAFDIAGITMLYLPRFSNPDNTNGNSGGFLTPDARYDRILGLTVIAPYYLPIRSNADLTLTPYVFSDAAPMLGAEYRQMTALGPFRVGGLVTYSRVYETSSTTGETYPGDEQLRGYFYGNGQLQLSSDWRLTAAIRVSSDDNFLRRYDITQDDVLRNLVRAERFGDQSYLAVTGWAFQGLRPTDRGAQTPIVLPEFEWRYRPDDPVLGGNLDFLGSFLTVTRPNAEDVERAVAQARYTALVTTDLGQRITFTGQVRAEGYHASDAEGLAQQQYAGDNGWTGRVIPAAAIDVAWPFAGAALGGVQTITPRVQLVASPFVTNDIIPNADSRAIDLTENNLFDINRFPGYDRWEGGERVTYGLNWTLDRPKWRTIAEVGQSYRFSSAADLFPAGTGLTNQFSDIVGRFTVQYGSLVEITDRFRLAEGSLGVRRQEVDLTVGTNRTYAQIAYTRLSRDLAIEDLVNTDELRAAARVQFARYWSVFGATILNLSAVPQPPLNTLTGFQPIRHRVGIAYDDECFTFSFSWRRDYTTVLDRPAGDSFLFRVAFKTFSR